MDPLAIVIPLKEFALAKSRLRRAGVTDVDERSRDWATKVIAASEPRPVYVACESSSVARFAEALGTRVLLSDARGLNEAVDFACRSLSSSYQTLMIAHGDLRDPTGLGAYEPPASVTIVADHHGTGTNVLVVPGASGFRFAFGNDSARRHVDEAIRLDLDYEIIRESAWSYDVDEPEDIVR